MNRPVARAGALAVTAGVVIAGFAGRVQAARGEAPGAERPAQVFALVVTNNRSASLDRPDLQYADDDGARYYEMFRAVAGAERVTLLTRFDRATAATHQALGAVARPPRRAEVEAALSRLQAQVAEARRQGEPTRFYFVFAGHGDVDGGQGYLDLEDGRMDGGFLEHEVVERIGADVIHVLLDSCNSFFVVNPRRPGGRRWATPRDMALGFARRHPNVGLFLSTNSEAEVYEWSELESGVFSHEVRSGLSGAADADGDGRVSYAELAGFVDRANAGLPRAALRPQIYYRGPADDGSAPLYDTRFARGRRIALGAGEQRLWVRSPLGERLLDVHKEPGPASLLVPVSPGEALSVVERRLAGLPGTRPELVEYQVPPGDDRVSLATLAPLPPGSGARSGSAMFGQLFASPFGPQALATYLKTQTAVPEPVYGISAADEARMRHYLTFIARSDHEIARNQGIMVGTAGGLFIASAVGSFLTVPRWNGSASRTLTLGGAGVALLGAGLYLGLTRPPGQRALEAFEAELRAAPDNRALAVARTETYLDQLAQRERRTSWVMPGIFWTAAALGAAGTTTLLVEGDIDRRHPHDAIFGYGFSAAMALLGWMTMDMELPTTRLLRLYREDPDLRSRLGVGVAPLPGGFQLSLGGRF